MPHKYCWRIVERCATASWRRLYSTANYRQRSMCHQLIDSVPARLRQVDYDYDTVLSIFPLSSSITFVNN